MRFASDLPPDGRQAADKAGLSLSEYARHKLLSQQFTVRAIQGYDPALFDQIRRIGINLNQAVHKLHATGRTPPELARAAAAVEAYILRLIDGS